MFQARGIASVLCQPRFRLVARVRALPSSHANALVLSTRVFRARPRSTR
jgi:hypothetical protein